MKRIIFRTYLMGFLLMTGFAYGQDVAATTSVLSSIIREIGGGKIAVATLVPPGSCPGHFDLKTSDLISIEKSGILFAQGFEEYLDRIKASVKNPDFKPVIIEIKGNWLVPGNQKKAYLKISNVLSEKFPQYRDLFEQSSEKAIVRINETDRTIKTIAAEHKVSGVRVICNDHISGILEYLGFEVVSTYGRKEELTPASVKKLISVCRRKNVRMVVDNLQAGPDTGRVIANELNIPHLAISNFPGGFTATPTLRETLLENTKRLINIYENTKNTAN